MQAQHVKKTQEAHPPQADSQDHIIRATDAGTDIAPLADNAKTEYRARNMGFIFQVYDLLPVLSTVENAELPLLVSGVSARQAREKAMDALEVVHLADWARHRPAELSGGQRQRVAVARAPANQPA